MKRANAQFLILLVGLFTVAYWLVKHLAEMSQKTAQGGWSPDLTPGSTAGDYSNIPPTADVDNAYSVVGAAH